MDLFYKRYDLVKLSPMGKSQVNCSDLFDVILKGNSLPENFLSF